MVKSDIIKKFKFPEIKTQEDFGLWLKLLRNNYKFLGINTIYSSWRERRVIHYPLTQSKNYRCI